MVYLLKIIQNLKHNKTIVVLLILYYNYYKIIFHKIILLNNKVYKFLNFRVFNFLIILSQIPYINHN